MPMGAARSLLWNCKSLPRDWTPPEHNRNGSGSESRAAARRQRTLAMSSRSLVACSSSNGAGISAELALGLIQELCSHPASVPQVGRFHSGNECSKAGRKAAFMTPRSHSYRVGAITWVKYSTLPSPSYPCLSGDIICIFSSLVCWRLVEN